MQRRMVRHVADDGKFGTPLAHPCHILFITPISSYTVFFSSLQFLIIQYSFHNSSFYVCSISITTVSFYTVFFSLLQLPSIYSFLFINPLSISVKIIFNKSHFCWCKQLFSSFKVQTSIFTKN